MPPWLVPVVAGGVSVVTATFGLIKYRMRLEFYKHVFDRNRDRLDLESAGRVMSPRWMATKEAVARRRARKRSVPAAPELRQLPGSLPNDDPPQDTPSGPASAA